MRLKLLIIGCVILFLTMSFSGCQEEAMVTELNVVLESDVVEFANVSFIKEKNREGRYIEAKLTWLFHNIAGRLIDVGIDFEFYDENDVIVYSGTKSITRMPADYTETFSPVYNTIVLTGDEAQQADHVIVRAYEI